MNFIFKKIIISSLLVVLFFLGLSLLKDKLPLSYIENACAACWGTACPGSTTYYSTCPQSGAVIAGPIYSADVHVTVASTGTSPIPPGQRLLITICPSTGCTPQNACSDVTCLNRSIVDYPLTWNGPGSIDSTFDTLGCSLNGTCSNNYTVKVRFDPNSRLDPTLNCPNDDKPVTLINDTTQQAPVALNCSKPVTVTCNETATQGCQQEATATGCKTGWVKNTTGLICTSPAVCCNLPACTTPLATPAPVVSCTL